MSLRNLDRHARRLREKARELEVPQALEDRFGPYRGDPVTFVEDELGAEPEPYQREVLAACAEDPRVAWRAAHGVGKTAALSWILLWWLLTRPFSRVLVVAPAFKRQVGRYLLPEVRRWCPPWGLLRRAVELCVEIRRELRHPARGVGCSTCGGAAFYTRDGSWACVRCEGLPAGEVPTCWALAGSVNSPPHPTDT